jgi:hypothetical protein
MKKILFCAAVVALATACTSEDDLVLNQGKSDKGLTFDVALAENAITRGELWKDENGTYPFFWYAETDRIDVYALNAEAGTSNTNGKGTAAETTGSWTLDTDGAASYKATKSEGQGYFTAADDANMLTLKAYDADDAATTTATIVATYGDITTTTVDSKVVDNEVVPGELTGLVVTTTAGNATQTVERANVVNAPMYSVSQAKREDAYSSFGEKAQLRMIRPFPVIRFTTKNTADYIEYFGGLKSVELTALGTKTSAGGVDVAASNLAYDNNKDYTIIGATTGFAAGYQAGSNPEKVTVTLTDGTWTDADAVYMTVAPVNRKAFRDKSQAEPLKVTYTFDNIEFTLDPAREGATDFEKVLKTSNDWTSVDAKGNPNAITPLPALDINNYNYLVTNVTGSNDRTLIVIDGNFKDIFADADNVAWNGTDVPVTEFKTILSKVNLTNDELATIKKFENLEELILNENTSIPANTFSTVQAGKITKLDLPKVTSIDPKFINNVNAADENGKKFIAITDLLMPAYEFENEVVNHAFFNSSEKGVLVNLDMSGVRSMMPKFGILRTLSFNGYSALETVAVQNGMIVSPSGFAACTSLKKVAGAINIEEAPSAFDMNAGANNALKEVEVAGTIVPAGAFNNCTALESIKYNKVALAPTSIGEKAFVNTTKLVYFDLSKTTTIGEEAFKGAGITSNAKTATASPLVVAATELPASVFENCVNIVMIKFTGATKITGDDILKGTTGLRQIKFLKSIAFADKATAIEYTNDLFGNTAEIDLWTNPAQAGVDGLKFTISYKQGTTTATKMYTFKSIQKKIED